MEDMIKEIQIEMLKNKKFREEICLALYHDYAKTDKKDITLKDIKKRTENLLRMLAEVELQTMMEEENYEMNKEIEMEN